MSNYVYPANLPGLTFNSTRSPSFNTGLQQALTGKESRIAYQQYSLMEWELQYELLRDYVSPSDLKALVGLFIAVKGKWDSFLYEDPVFNTATGMQFGVGDGVTATFPLTATYQNAGAAGGPELIQNLNGAPLIYMGTTLWPSVQYSLGPTGIITFNAAPAPGAVLNWSGSWYYRARFDDDSLTFTQFLQNFWSCSKVKLREVRL